MLQNLFGNCYFLNYYICITIINSLSSSQVTGVFNVANATVIKLK